MTETITEYGLRWSDGYLAWPDNAGDIETPDAFILQRRWGNESELQDQVAEANAADPDHKVSLVKRTYTVEDVAPALPTALGSVISAHIPETDSLVRLVRCSDPGTLVWRVVDDIDDDEGIWQYTEDLADVTVLFDAAVLDVNN